VLPLTTPLICVRPGRFQQAPLPIETASTVYLPSVGTSTSGPHSGRILLASENNELDVAEMATRPDPDEPSSDDDHHISISLPRRRLASFRLERVFTTLLLVILFAIALLIAAALLSPAANTLIATIVHVDIRAEIDSLWSLLQRIHF
jgi:hypothetical protein